MRITIIIVAALVLSFGATLVCYPHLPDPMATHFGGRGIPNGYSPKAVGAFIGPAVLLIPLASAIASRVLIKRARNPVGRKAFARLGVAVALPLTVFLLYVQALVLVWNLGVHFNMDVFLLPAVFLLIPILFVGMLPVMRLEVAAGRAARQSLPKNIWFPAKRFGWGWGFPCAWQGWVVMIVWLAGLATGIILILGRTPQRMSVPLYLAFLAAMVAVLAAVSYWKGEKPRWRWGDSDDTPE